MTRRCTSTCRAPSPTMAHCPTCHLTFGSVTSFDRHRSHGECLYPVDLGMAIRDGVWRTPMSDAARERMERTR